MAKNVNLFFRRFLGLKGRLFKEKIKQTLKNLGKHKILLMDKSFIMMLLKYFT
ncbi:MAG: hypothetical protein ACI9XO_001243 [Paraglaciecola sp.]|jgi:hypothetical protein